MTNSSMKFQSLDWYNNITSMTIKPTKKHMSIKHQTTMAVVINETVSLMINKLTLHLWNINVTTNIFGFPNQDRDGKGDRSYQYEHMKSLQSALKVISSSSEPLVAFWSGLSHFCMLKVGDYDLYLFQRDGVRETPTYLQCENGKAMYEKEKTMTSCHC